MLTKTPPNRVAQWLIVMLHAKGTRVLTRTPPFDVSRSQVMVGAGAGGPHLVMEQSGLTNLFPDLPGSFKCVPIADVIALDPDVMVLVEAGFNPSLDKIRFLYNHSDFCKQRYVQRADYIKVPFSASSLGPRNGAAALDIVTAALHVTTGGGSGSAMNFQSGVDTFDPEILAAHTAGLRCPVDLDKVKYAKTSYTSCGITHTLTRIPERVVTLNQGVTEFMLAMGLEDKMAGTLTRARARARARARVRARARALTLTRHGLPRRRDLAEVKHSLVTPHIMLIDYVGT